MTLEELLALLENMAELTAEQLDELLANLRTAADERLDGDLTDEVLAELEQIRDAVVQVSEEQAARAEADEERQARADALRQAINGEDDADASADDEDGGDGDDAGSDDGDDDAADDSDDQGDSDAEGADDADADAADDREPETVSASTQARRPRVSRVAARRPASVTPRPKPAAAPERLSLVAAANVPGVNAGSVLSEPDQIAQALADVIAASADFHGPRTKVPVFRSGSFLAVDQHGPERTLGRDPIENERKIRAVTSIPAVTASGGRCAPSPVRYDFPTVGSDAQPVRDQTLTRFGVDRGGIRLFPPVTFDDVDGGVGTWTNTTDTTPAENVKPCVVMTCPSDDETIVEAITRCLQVGNFRARFFAEQVEEWLTKLAQWQARYAESKRLTTMGTLSTQVSVATVLGTSVDVLTTLDRATAGYISRHRAPGQRFRFTAPEWLRAQIRTDIARTAYGTAEERLATADATIDSFFSARGINVTWHLDGESGQIFGSQADGALVGWPSTVVTYLHAEGDFLNLDGGSLDLGIVRDSVLNGTNDFQIFAETFEQVAFHGVEALRLTIDTCPDGSTSAPVDINPCAGGS